jgi:CRP/FNR family transcriptional regulator, cyclic AMP receptor protein
MVHIKLQLLQSIAVFGALSEDTLDFLLRRATEVRCDAGQYFFREGDDAQSIYILERGRVAVLKEWQGRHYLLGELGAGACFGEMALMDMHARSASVLATEETLAFKIGAGALLELYEHDIEQFTLLQMNLGREVSRRLREADERIFHCRVSPEIRTQVPAYPEYPSPTPR